MAKLSMADQTAKSRTPFRSKPQSYTPEHHPTPMDVTSSPPNAAPRRETDAAISSLTSTSPPSMNSKSSAGGEIKRIQETTMQDQLGYFQEAENCRPDYLKRVKRALSEADPTALVEDETTRQRDRETVVGITESPIKGRRLKLFQETSEESFEESLMAGGYGRYVSIFLGMMDSPAHSTPVNFPENRRMGSPTTTNVTTKSWTC